jgi:hypothetical protein
MIIAKELVAALFSYVFVGKIMFSKVANKVGPLALSAGMNLGEVKMRCSATVFRVGALLLSHNIEPLIPTVAIVPMLQSTLFSMALR